MGGAQISALRAKLSIPLPFKFTAAVLGATATFAVGAASLVPYPRFTSAMGVLQPVSGARTLVSPFDGVVGRVNMKEGAVVKAGDLLLEIYSPTADRHGTDLGDAVQITAQAEAAAIASQAESSERRLAADIASMLKLRKALQADSKSFEQDIEYRRQQAKISVETEARYATLGREQIVSVIQVDQQRIAVLEAKGYVEALVRQKSSTDRQIVEIERNLFERGLERESISQNAELARKKVWRDEATASSQRGQRFFARAPGRVSSVLVKDGEATKFGQPMMELVAADSRIQGVLVVSSSKLESVMVGNEVGLRIRAFPSHKHGVVRSRISYVSNVAIPSEEVRRLALEADPSERYFKVVVDIDRGSAGSERVSDKLLSGMTFDADIKSDERTFVQWVVEPLWRDLRRD